MRKPSRFMPQVPKNRLGFLAYIALAAMTAALLYSLWKHPLWTLAAILSLAAGAAVSLKSSHARLKQLAAGRSRNGDICSFARSFDLHKVDPWVVRAVYEEVTRHFKGLGVDIQVCADDDLINDLGIDPEDLDMGIAMDIAARTGRSFDGYKKNPYLAETSTVRGLVMFFNAQPRAA
jgi:hypothetical protein